MSTERRFESDPTGGSARGQQTPDQYGAFNSPGLTSEVLIAEYPSYLRSLEVYNSHSATLYLQVFDSASEPSNGATPIMVVPVATKTVGKLDFGDDGYRFLNGIYACLSTTDTTKTEAGALGFWWSRAS